MDYFPAHLNLQGKRCLVVGGGEVALRKGSLLVRSGAWVRVVSPEVLPELEALVSNDKGEVHKALFSKAYLDDVMLAVAATDDPVVNRAVSDEAHKRQLLVNVVDVPSLSNFIVPAIIDRAPLTLSISSGGRSPVLARMLRAKLEAMVPASYGALAELVGRYREQVKERFSHINDRRRFWERILEGSVAERVFSGQRERAEQLLVELLADKVPQKGDDALADVGLGEVFLVGAGPGDPDLLTFKALRLMQKADVVLYDRLVSPGVLDLVRRDAQRIYVGKARDKHALPQEEINQSLVTLAQKGHRVCRLKGGDPFIFGRGGEEIDQLAAANIPFQVVPGITAASGCACYAGIPLTHRDYAQSVRFVTGHLKEGAPELNWRDLITARETLVIYMGLVGLKMICERLIEHGMDPNMPIALIQQGTTQHQRVLTGRLEHFAAQVGLANEKESIHAPTLTVIGEVVSLHGQLEWFTPAG